MEGMSDSLLVERRIIASLSETGWKFHLAASVLLLVVGIGVWQYVRQLTIGLATTGMNRSVYWGVYMANFVFFTGISMAGTLISAILRVMGAEWRRPITRCAEVITVFGILFGALSVLVDLGRPDRVLNVILHGRLQSPIAWDVFCINLYLAGSLTYLYLPLIPDVATLRDRRVEPQILYRLLAIGYTGTARQKKILETGISIMAVLIIPIAVSVHTVVSYIFATTLQPGWHSTIFGPYFVVGAIFSGIAALMIAMAIIRKAYHLEGVLKDVHFNNLALVLLATCCLIIYFTFNIYLVEITGDEPFVMKSVMEKVAGRYTLPFWGMILGGFILPAVILAFPRGRSVTGCVVASVLILVAMWLERFLIVVPTLMHPRMPWPEGLYTPTWTEWAITAGCVAAFALLYMAFTKVFPIVSMWEVNEGIEEALPHVSARLSSYLPELGEERAPRPRFRPVRVRRYLTTASPKLVTSLRGQTVRASSWLRSATAVSEGGAERR
jgi:molybdopterin-containing oxidoreductase family membrane subunit